MYPQVSVKLPLVVVAAVGICLLLSNPVQAQNFESVGAATIDYIDKDGNRLKIPSKGTYGGDLQVDYCIKIATKDSAEHQAVMAKFNETFILLFPWEADQGGSLEIRCDYNRVTPGSIIADPIPVTSTGG